MIAIRFSYRGLVGILSLMKPNPELRKRIVEVYQNGAVSMETVAKTLGISPPNVWYHLKKSGVPMRKQGHAIKSRLGASDPRLGPSEHPTIHDICWAAGIYEGEGSVVWDAKRGARYANVLIAQKDTWLTDRLRALFGGAITVQHQRTAGRPTPIIMHYWRLTGARARGFLLTIYQFLSPRRQLRIREALTA